VYVNTDFLEVVAAPDTLIPPDTRYMFFLRVVLLPDNLNPPKDAQ
jgi:hypothetical protein